MAGIEIITVEGGSELRDFIDLPWKILCPVSQMGSSSQKRSPSDVGPL